MINLIDDTHDYVNELEGDIKIYEKYVANQKKKIDEWKASWESAEKRCGELERNLKSLRELSDLEIGEWEEQEQRIRNILDDIPFPPGKFKSIDLNEWIAGYTAWHTRMMEHLSDEV